MNILLIEPYFTGSHAVWAKGYQKYSSNKVDILSMSGHYWKWRMHGGAVTLARKFLDGNYHPDVILATDMLDLTTFQGLTRQKTANIPFFLYFHENQMAYPWSPKDRDVKHGRDNHYSFINYSSALAANKVFFNSNFHFDVFFNELNKLLRGFPDHSELSSIIDIRKKSRVLPLGLDLSQLDAHKSGKHHSKPLILWNHRWEHDKNPEEFFEALYILADKGLDFELALLGENFSKEPQIFQEAKARLGHRIVQYGYADSFEEYAKWLWKADILPVTSNQDFFGASVVQAMHCNCYPLLPKRLAFPEHIPAREQENFLYNDFDELLGKLEHAILNIGTARKVQVRNFVKNYQWELMAPVYDKMFKTP